MAGDKVRFRLKPKFGDEYSEHLQVGRVYEGDLDSEGDVDMEEPPLVVMKNEIDILKDNPPLIELHQSDAEALWSCPHAFYLGAIKGLQVRKRPDYYAVGEMYHHGVAIIRHPVNRKKEPSIDKRLTAAKDRIHREYADVDTKLVEDVFVYLEKFVRNEKEDPLDEIIEVEIPLTYRHPDWQFGLAIGGTLDAVIRDRHAPKKLWSGEWKTAQRVNVGYFRSMKNGPQPAWYHLLLIQNLKYMGLKDIEQVRGTVYEICPKTDYPVQRESAILDSTTFTRGTEYVSASIDRASELLRDNRFPRVLTSCYGKFNTECRFMPWCYRGGHHQDNHEDLLNTMFRIVEPMVALKERQNHVEDYII